MSVRTPTPEDFEQVEETDGIFTFGKETYVWAWFSVPFKGGDLLGCVYRYEPKGAITFTYRFRYHASAAHFDPRDTTRTYCATFEGPPEKALEGARLAALGVAREHGTEVEELTVGQGHYLVFDRMGVGPKVRIPGWFLKGGFIRMVWRFGWTTLSVPR